MRDIFPEFYSRDDDAWQALWDKATFILDANVLLTLTAIPPATRDEMFAVFEDVKDRLWVPHQAALEYQRNRTNKARATVATWGAHCDSMSSGINSAENAMSQLELEKWEMHTEKKVLEKNFQALKDSVSSLTATLKEHFAATVNDAEVRSRLDRLLSGRVGHGPASQEEMEALIADADKRYESRIAPGFLDVAKDKGSAPTYRYRGVTYAKKYGDLILWRQLLMHAKEQGLSHVVFVTEDKKEDWWEKSGHEIVAPHPDLVYEANAVGGISDFHMYTAAQFFGFAARRSNAFVSESTLTELETTEEPPWQFSDGALSGNYRHALSGVLAGTLAGGIPVTSGGIPSDSSARGSMPRLPWRDVLFPILQAGQPTLAPPSGLLGFLMGDSIADMTAREGLKEVAFAIVDLNPFPETDWERHISDRLKAMLRARNHASLHHLVIVLPLLDEAWAPSASVAYQGAISWLAENVASTVEGVIFIAPGGIPQKSFPPYRY